jgi:hypothetical protein
MLRAPLTGWLAGLADTENVTTPLPDPGLPDAIAIELWLLAAIQGHLGGVFTVTVPVPPVASNS